VSHKDWSSRLGIAFFLVAASLQSFASTPATPAAGLADTLALLTRQSAAWDKAIVRKDKAEFVRDLTGDDIVIDPYTVEDFNVRVYGDVALLNGRTHMTGHQEGKPFKTQYIYVDIYRRINGQWKVCSVQTTRLPS
jgi:Domain of unknown function (DUF4440)